MRKKPASRLSRFASRFVRAERGATAIEFGLVSVPILMMIFGLLEIALVFLVGTTLDQATQASARQIRTGAFQTGATPTKAAFKALVCQRMTWLQSKCNADLWLDVQTYSTYGALAAAPPLAPSTFNPNTTCFYAGQPKDIVLVRAYFEWNLITPLLSVALQNMSGGRRLISSTTAFRNEPYNENPPQGQRCT